MVEIAGHELDSLAGIVDRLAARLGLLVGLALGFLVGAFLRGELGLDLAASLLLELLLALRFGILLLLERGGRLFGLLALLIVGTQFCGLLLGLESFGFGLFRHDARLDHLGIRPTRRDGVVTTAAQQ